MRHGLRGYPDAHSDDFRPRDFPGLSARELVLLGTAHSTDYRPDDDRLRCAAAAARPAPARTAARGGQGSVERSESVPRRMNAA